MFSSPSRGTPRRKVVGAPSSVRSATPVGRASTPTLGKYPSRRRGESVQSNDATIDAAIRGAWSEMRREKARSELEEGTVLSRDDVHAVTTCGRMPLEVTATLQNMGMYSPSLSYLDSQTGFAYLSTQDKCFVWSFAGRNLESPPCYTFPVPASPPSTSSIVSHTLPFCSLIVRGPDREPGLIIVTESGDVRFCDNVVSSLSGDRMAKTSIPLGTGESVSQLHRCGTSFYLAATTQSRLFSVQFVASGGSLQAHVSPFTQSRGLFGRLFGTASQLGSSMGIIRLASCLSRDNSGAFELYAMGQSVLQKWSVVEGGGERLVGEDDIKLLLLNQTSFAIDANISADSFALVDVAATSTGAAAVLSCHATSANGPLRYQVSFLECSSSASPFSVRASFSLDYTRYPDSRPYSQPRLLLPYGGPVAFVVYPEAVVMRLIQGKSFEETVEMRDVSANRIIGVAAEGPDVEAPSGVSSLSVVAAISGALLVEVDTERAQEVDQQLSTGDGQVLTARLKSRIERGVFHSDNLHNPISFDLPLDIRGNLMAAVEQLSEEIVQSRAPGLSNSVDLRVQLADRLDKLHGLASFVASNGKLSLLSQNALRRLCSDAELVAAAMDIWDYQNSSLARSVGRGSNVDRLGIAIKTTVESLPEAGWEGDCVRFFFRHRLDHLNNVLARLPSSGDSAVGGILEKSAGLVKVNHIFLSTFQAAYRYRSETATLYHLDFAHISHEAWTCAKTNIESLQKQFAETVSVLQDRKRHLGLSMEEGSIVVEEEEIASQQQSLRGQLCDLASCTLDIFAERLAYLRAAGTNSPSLEKQARLLEEEYSTARSQIIPSLVDVGRSDRSFYLAEKHRDFAVLTQLCCAMKGNNQVIRIRSYLDKYQGAFAFELYDHYVRQGEIAKLLEEEEDYHHLLSDFLQSKREYNRIAWLQDINLKEWSQASARLQEEADRETEQASGKKLMLSLHKLCHVAQLQERDVASEREQERIEAIDDQLDIINVHRKIRLELQVGDTLLAQEQQQPIDLEESLLLATELLGQVSPALKMLYCALAKRLVGGAVLSCEDLIDLLSLPDTSNDSIEHFKMAMEVVVRATDIPSARKAETLTCLWRRIILHDDWLQVTDSTASSTTDEVLMAKLKGTAYYQTLQFASENQATAEMICRPSECLEPPSRTSLSARLHQEDQRFLDEVQRDCMAEVERAREVVDAGLAHGWFDDVMRLLTEAQDAHQDSQLAMDNDGSESMAMS